MCFQSIVAVVGLRHHNRQHLPVGPCQGRGAVNARQIKPHRSPQCWRRQAHHLDDVPYLSRAPDGGVIAPPQVALGFTFGYRFNPSHANIYEGPDDLEAYFHWEYLQQGLSPDRRGEVSTFSVRLRAAEDAGRVSRTIDDMFRNAPQPTRTETEKAFMLSYISMIGNIKLFLLSIATALVFTILLVNANSVAMSVRERVREVALMKTLGFSSASVLTMIVGESVVVSLAGGILGVGLCYLATLALANQSVMYIQGFALPWWGVPVCLIAAVSIGVLSSLPPAAIAVRMTITEALRHGD